MKISLILIQSLDGFLATDQSDDLSWGTREDKIFYKAKTQEIGTVIMGSTTYQKMPAKAFENRKTLVLTSNPAKYQADPKAENIEFFSGTALAASQYLESQGVSEAALVGGSIVNGQFLAAGLITDLYITIAPILFGTGIKSFFLNNDQLLPGQLQTVITKLKLLELKNISDNEILIHYQVLN